MQMWDQLCTWLRARTISVEDVSNKVLFTINQLYILIEYACLTAQLLRVLQGLAGHDDEKQAASS